MDQKICQTLIADLRNAVIICALTIKWEEKKKITEAEAYSVLKKGIEKATRILKELAEIGNL